MNSKTKRLLAVLAVILIIVCAVRLFGSSGTETAPLSPSSGSASSLQILEEPSAETGRSETETDADAFPVLPAETEENKHVWEEQQPAEPEENIPDEPESEPEESSGKETPAIDRNGTYTSCDDVALYIYTYGCLPSNFITKNEAKELGWTGGSLEPYAPGCSIGGDRFGNHEGLLPKASGRTYTECDIDTMGQKSRGAKRIVFSNDGLIYYTDDHYESFTLLYGEE